jgi:hypothetical protein
VTLSTIRLIGLPLIALSACANPAPSQRACVVADASGFVGAGGGQAHMTVARNGDPCVVAASIRRGPMGQGEIAVAPAHGTATVRTTEAATLISFTPSRDYTGEDKFEVAFGPDFRMTVLVQVVPIATGPAAPR